MSQSELVFLPLGGVGEIGMNMALYGVGPATDRQWMIVDCGISFGDDSLPGIDVILPDIRFVKEQGDAVHGIVITHAHEDHFGALIHTWDQMKLPVYATAFVAGLIEAKCIAEPGAPKIPVQIVEQGDSIDVGPFNVTFIPVSHSIPEPNALAIRTEHGLVVHTGDWKLDQKPGIGKPTDVGAFKAMGKEGVLALVCDSTNAMREGDSPSEEHIAQTLDRIIAEAPERVAVTTFASNVARVIAIAKAAKRADRQCVLSGRALLRFTEIAGELGYLDGLPSFLSEDEYGYLPRNKVVVILTGTQGEPRAALARVASGEHRKIRLSPGDLMVFSSRAIPGNEKNVNQILNNLAELGIRTITDSDADVHVTGHPRRNELEKMYSWLQPKIAIPVHGEAMHLEAHLAFAKEQGVGQALRVRNGWMARLAPAADTWNEFIAGRIYKDGRIVGDAEEVGVQRRRKLSFAGHVAVSVVLDQKRGEIHGTPQFTCNGLPVCNVEGIAFDDLISDTIESVTVSIPRARRKDPAVVQEAIRRGIRSVVYQHWSKKPICDVMISTL